MQKCLTIAGILCVVMLFHTSGWSSSGISPELQRALERAKWMHEQGRRDSLLLVSEQALELIGQIPQPSVEVDRVEAFFNTLAGVALRWKRNNNDAFEISKKALAYYIEHPDTDIDAQALANWTFGMTHPEKESRRAFLDKAFHQLKHTADSASMVGVCIDLAISHYRAGYLEQMRDYAEHGIAWAPTDVRPSAMARIYYQYGRYFDAIRDHASAGYFHKKAYDLISEHAPRDPVLFNISRDLGLAYKVNGQYAEALQVFSSLITPDTPAKSSHRHFAESDLLFEIGRVHADFNQSAQAERFLLQSVRSLQRSNIPRYHIYTANPWATLANIYLSAGDTVSARMQLYSVDTILAAADLFEHPDYARINIAAARAHIRMDEPTMALKRINSGYAGLSYNVSDPQNFTTVYRYDLLAELMLLRTNMLYQMWLDQPHPENTRELDTQLSDHLMFLDSLNQFNLTAAVRTEIMEGHFAVFEMAIEQAVEMYKATNNNLYLKKAVEISERSKDQLMERVRMQNQMRSLSGVSDGLRKRESEIMQELADLELEIFKQANQPSNSQTTRQQRLNIELSNLSMKINGVLPSMPHLSFDQMTRQVPPHTAWLEFFSGDHHHFAFMMVGSQIHFVRDNASEQAQRISTLRNLLMSPESDWEPAANAVFKDLLPLFEQLPNAVEQVVIAADGPWSGIPFEVFSNNGEYLMALFDVSYLSSIRAMSNPADKPHGQKILGAFAPRYDMLHVDIADTLDAEAFATLVRSGNYDLPGAREEVIRITEIMGGDAFFDEKADETTFRAIAGNYEILHLSMHALLEERNPRMSRLVFTSTDHNESDDYLFTSELQSMQLDAQLAVLSACNTGSGQFVKGEGVMSLSRGFHYAGVPSVVHSLWKVPDASTSLLMVEFYHQLNAGNNKASALRLAKQSYLDQVVAPEQRHPFYWAGFVASGDMRPINSTRKQSFVLPLIGVTTALLLWLMLRRRRSTSTAA